MLAGKRSIGGLVDDGVKSMVRYYLNNFQVSWESYVPGHLSMRVQRQQGGMHVTCQGLAQLCCW